MPFFATGFMMIGGIPVTGLYQKDPKGPRMCLSQHGRMATNESKIKSTKHVENMMIHYDLT